VARYRKTAIAALAVSALLLTPSAAYAHDGHDHRGVAGPSTASGMSWGYSSAELTDFTTKPEVVNPDIFKGAKATALMMSIEDSTYFRLRVTGIHKSAIGDKPYGVHLHEAKCEPGDGAAAGRHYNISPWNEEKGIWSEISGDTEVWLDIDVNSYGNARSSAAVSFIPDPGERSIVLHQLPTTPVGETGVGSAGARLACLPFNIKSLPR
jgi:Cu/Zn superoxide dismutase